MKGRSDRELAYDFHRHYGGDEVVEPPDLHGVRNTMKLRNGPNQRSESPKGDQAKRLKVELATCRAELAEAREREAAAEERSAEVAQANLALRNAAASLQDLADLDGLLVRVLAAAERVSGACSATVFLVHDDRREMKMRLFVRDGAELDINSDPSLEFWRQPFVESRNYDQRIGDMIFDTPGHWWVAVDDPLMSPTMRAWHEAHGHRFVAHLPMFRDGRRLGFLGLSFSGAVEPSAVKLDVVRVLANQVTLTFQLTKLLCQARDAAVAQEREVAAEERASQLARANQALASSTARLAAEPDLDAFLGAVLVEAAEQAGACGNALFLHDEPSDTLSMTVIVREGCLLDVRTDPRLELWRAPVPADLTGAWQRLKAARPILQIIGVDEPDVWEFAIPWHRGMGHGSLICVPLLIGDRALGFMGLCFREQAGSAPELVELAQALANQAALAIELTRLADAASKSAVSDERNRIARDIHDTLAQDFTAIVAHLQSVRRKLASSGLTKETAAGIVTGLEAASEAAQEGLMEARRSVWALAPHSLERGEGCAAALHAVVTRLAPDAKFIEHGNRRTLPVAMQAELLGVCREAVANAVRHAGAKANILVSVAYEADRVEMAISDDGAGFDALATEKSGGGRFGLWTMRERAARVGGQLDLTSQPGRGTRLSMVCPLAPELAPGVKANGEEHSP